MLMNNDVQQISSKPRALIKILYRQGFENPVLDFGVISKIRVKMMSN